jgi:hypothetical protein
MLSKRSVGTLIVLAFFTLLVGSSVFADDGRINRPPYHFGGDTLFCNEADGCTLLNKDGHDLANWLHSAIVDAFAKTDKSGQNAQVDSEGQGTYGPMQLWSVKPDTDNGDHKLCLIGFDEWGKQNAMCFKVTKDQHYEQAPLPVTDNSCDGFYVGQFVMLKSDSNVFGEILSIDLNNHTVTFGKSFPVSFRRASFNTRPSTYTAKCSEVEVGRPT